MAGCRPTPNVTTLNVRVLRRTTPPPPHTTPVPIQSGWPVDITNDDALRELLALNGDRCPPGYRPVYHGAKPIRFRERSGVVDRVG